MSAVRTGAARPHGGYRREAGGALVEEVVDVEYDDVVPDEHRHDRASARKGPNGIAVLRPCAGALAGDHDGADEHARDQRDQDRRRDGAAEKQAHHACELDVAHAHAAGIGQRGEQQEAAGGRAGDQAAGSPDGSSAVPSTIASTAPAR